MINLKRKSNEAFKKEMQEKHPNLEVLSEYINGRTKVNIKCKKCGHNFMTTPGSLYMGHGCPKCVGVSKKTNQEFIAEMKIINPNILILGKYAGSKKDIRVSCKVCNNEWVTTPNSLLHKKGCAKCAGTIKRTHKEFISEIKAIHPNIEIIGTYTNNHTRIKCYCKSCNSYFYGLPHSMISAKSGCLHCSKSNSKGEISISNWLNNNHIKYIKEYRFNDCRDKYALPFDFYIPERNIVIEFDGKQHYETNKYFAGIDGFLKRREHDEIKNEYCMTHDIHLIRIPYWDFDNIDKILSTELAS